MTPQQVATLVEQQIQNGQYQISAGAASSLEDDVGASYANDRIRMQATGIFGILALFLIAAGIYGLMAYVVAQRAREIGVRMAIGSTAGGIMRLVLKDSLKLVAIGLLMGIPAALVSMRVLSDFAYQLSPTDPVSLIGAVTILVVTGLLAAAGPALHAARVDPMETLRGE